jgi:hypothetical protein
VQFNTADNVSFVNRIIKFKDKLKEEEDKVIDKIPSKRNNDFMKNHDTLT